MASPEHLNEAKVLAVEISKRRPQWSGGFALDGQLAELTGSSDKAITFYVRAVELGNVQPSLVRRLVMLLNERNRFDEIEHVAQVLRDQGAALSEVKIVRAVDALREGHSDQGLELARQLFPASSTNSSDHLALGRFYAAAGRSDEAGQEFRRAVDLGRGVPDNWLAYVQHLVETKRIDQARAAIDAAGKALPADRAALTLARCSAIGRRPRASRVVESAGPERPPSDRARPPAGRRRSRWAGTAQTRSRTILPSSTGPRTSRQPTRPGRIGPGSRYCCARTGQRTRIKRSDWSSRI